MQPIQIWKLVFILLYGLCWFWDFSFYAFLITSFILLIFLILTFFPFNISYIVLFRTVNYFNFIWFFLLWLILWGYIYFKNSKSKSFQNYLQYKKNEYQILKKNRFRYTFYGIAYIEKVLYPGMYITKFRITKIQPYYRTISRYRKKFNWIDNPDIFYNQEISTAIQVSKKDLWEGCEVQIFFYGKVFFYPLDKKKNKFFQYLKKQGAHYNFKIMSKNIQNVRCKSNIRNRIRQKIFNIIQNSMLNVHQKEIALGLIFGKSGWMSIHQKRKIKELGILHLFAASGLHLGILFYVFYYPLSIIFGKKHIISFSFPLPFLFFYLYILNFPYTLIRAYIFLIMIVFQIFIHRKMYYMDVLFNTLIVMILILPDTAINLSTILSFSAVSGILYFFPFLKNLFIQKNWFPHYHYKQRILSFMYRFIIMQFIVTFSASLWIQPILFFVFKGYSLISPMVNMILVPIVSGFLPLLFLGIGIEFLSEYMITNWIWYGIKVIFNVIEYLIDLFYKINIWIVFPHSWNIGFFVSIAYGCIVFLFSFMKKNRINTIYKKKETQQLFWILYVIYQSIMVIMTSILFYELPIF